MGRSSPWVWIAWLCGGCATAHTTDLARCGDCAPTHIPAWVDRPSQPAAEGRPSTVLFAAPAYAPRSTVIGRDEVPADPVLALFRTRRGNARLRSMSVRDAPALDVLRVLAHDGNVNLVAGPDVRAQVVTVELHDVTVSDAFFAVLRASGLDADVVAGSVVAIRAAVPHTGG